MPRASTPSGTRPFDRLALGLMAVILGGFFVGFEWPLAGSWRHLGALLLALGVAVGGAAALDAALRRAGRPFEGARPPVWWFVGAPALGAAGGAAYALADAERVTAGPVRAGAWYAGFQAALSFLWARRAARVKAPAA